MNTARQSSPCRGIGQQRHGRVEVVEAGDRVGRRIGRLELRGALTRLLDIGHTGVAERLGRYHQLLGRAREQFSGSRRSGNQSHSHDDCRKGKLT
jgi:hypothetical protein